MAAEVGGCGTNMPAAAHFLVIFAASGKNNPQSAFSQQFTRRRWREKGVTATFFAAYGLPQPPFLLNFRCHIHFFLPPYIYILLHTCVFLPPGPFVEKFLVKLSFLSKNCRTRHFFLVDT
jgi:hypothetical protein